VGHRERANAIKAARQDAGLCVQCAQPNDRKDETSKNGRHARYCTGCLREKQAQEARNRERAAASVDAIRRALGGRS